MEPSSLGAAQAGACAHHAERESVAVCSRCGDYVCTACRAETASAQELCVRCADLVGVSRYYPVPVWRFIAFGVATFGLYVVYWAYRTWRRIKQQDGSDLWPVARAVFFGFTHFSLVEDLNTQLAARDRRLLSIAGPAAYLLLGIAGRVTEKLDDTGGWSLLIAMLAVLSVVPTLQAVRSLSGSAELEECAILRPRHWLGFAICTVLFLLTLLGLFGEDAGLPES